MNIKFESIIYKASREYKTKAKRITKNNEKKIKKE